MKISPSDPLVLVVPDDLAGTNSGQVTVDLSTLQAGATEAQATADQAVLDAADAQNSADEAQATASAAIPAANGFGPWGVPGHWGRLTHQPHVAGVLSTSTAETGRIVYFPCDPTADIPIVQWAVEVTNTPVGTSLTVSIARYSVHADGTPDALVADYSDHPITIPNAPAAIVLSSVFSQVTIPQGRWMLAALFLGTAGGTPPILRTLTGHPSIGAATPTSLNTNGGYRSPDTTNVAFPLSAVIGSDQGRGGILLYAKRA